MRDEPSGVGREWKVHAAARLKQEASKEDNAQDDGKRDDDDLDESHSRVLNVKALSLVREGILSARGVMCQRLVLKGKSGTEYLFIETVRRKVCVSSARTWQRICGFHFVLFRMLSWIISCEVE